MHLLAVQPGQLVQGDEAVDLGQTPGEIVVLSAADSDLTCLSRAAAGLGPDAPSVRLANLLGLSHPLSVDVYVDKVIGEARFVCVRLLGGRSYWPYGLEEIARVCRERDIAFAALLSDDADDPDAAALSTLGAEDRRRLLAYLLEGGLENAGALLRHAAHLIGRGEPAPPPEPMPEAGLYWPGAGVCALDDVRRHWDPAAPVAALVFYRHMVGSGATAAIDALVAALAEAGLSPLPIFVPSLKNPFAASLLADVFGQAAPQVVLNTTAFAASTPGEARRPGPLDGADAAVLQVVMAASSVAAWRADARGLGARDLAMNVALPEVDGRVLAGAAAFKAEARFDPLTECAVVEHAPAPGNIAHIAALAAGWAALRRTPAPRRKVALVLANYPNRDGRLANGVGLDTPESAAVVLRALAEAGYDVAGAPASSRALMAELLAGPTNAARQAADATGVVLPLADYLAAFDALPVEVREAIRERWGEPQDDPFFRGGGFNLAIRRYGATVVGVQPARGYNIDPKGTYHDPALVPPHGYFAFYAWLRQAFGAHAIVHLGKHGNLEWLPGKALALSDACFPRAIAGATPQLYPFIVNDPGEGSQAKRRISAVIVDHLTPPLTRAESYGPLKALETLVDEYYVASGMDRRRLAPLKAEILELARLHGLDKDAGATGDDDEALVTLDNYLCELKEMQIRDGLHVFGRSPEGRLRDDLLVALTRTPRGMGQGGDASLIRALAQDLGLGFDPLAGGLGEPWTGPKPAVLAALVDDAWRTVGDTVERLEALASRLVAGAETAAPDWIAGRAVLASIDDVLRPRVEACGGDELDGLLRGLAGRFVAPGSSGAPTRGRPDVLPTGRNFYSVDTRAVPTPTAWRLGFASAQRLVEDHLQRTGEPLQAVVLSAWGTANMRTGGDDIAQALALMGARPTWDAASGRVTGFEILPLAVLGRPRVDVTMRISGFFRDAFIDQIALIDAAARAVMALDEAEDDNPAAARFVREQAKGADARRAGARIFGARPGAYGAGLQAMIDERLWTHRRDLAEAFLVWGGYAYGGQDDGVADRAALEARLAQVDAVVHNQDNREHDLLDSDDYYQFEGGLSAAVEAVRGAAPAVYHNDHSRPERPVIRSLEEEIGRVVRGRMVNPKWIAGVMRHGYKGAFEIAASVDYLFAFAATTDAVKDHHFDLAYQAFVEDEAVAAFMADANPHALREMASRLMEAIERGLWKPRSNSASATLAELAGASR